MACALLHCTCTESTSVRLNFAGGLRSTPRQAPIFSRGFLACCGRDRAFIAEHQHCRNHFTLVRSFVLPERNAGANAFVMQGDLAERGMNAVQDAVQAARGSKEELQTHTGSSNGGAGAGGLWGDRCSLSTAGMCRNAAANHRC